MYTLYDAMQSFKPAVSLERMISRQTLGSIRAFGLAGGIVGMSAAAGLYYFPNLVGEYASYRNIAAGIGLFGIATWLDSFLGIVYHNNYYFSGIRSTIDADPYDRTHITYDVAKIALSDQTDIVKAFVESDLGRTVLVRSECTPAQIEEYLASNRHPISASMISLPPMALFSLIGLGTHILKHDHSFQQFLSQSGVTEATYTGALRWVTHTQHQYKATARWWSRDNLSQTKSIGRTLSLGTAYMLQKFARDIRTTAVFSTMTRDRAYAREQVEKIEQTLARTKAANVLLIGEAGVGKTDLIMEVSRRINSGEALAALENEQLIVLDTNRLFAVCADKQSFEETIQSLLHEALAAGRITIVIEHLSNVIKETEALGVYLPELLDEYLAHPQLHFIATDTPAAYHTHLETLGGFVRRFVEIDIETPDNQATVRILQQLALQKEAAGVGMFSYAAVAAIAAAADRYVTEGVMPDKAITLFETVTSRARTNQITTITADYVYSVVGDVTGVPTGPIHTNEREQLLHLEDALHQQVVGQDRAISAIARTMRRARTGLQAADKPIGSFLFLGPTGVGKTETAKALANVFFGGEHNLQRIDMSEFSGEGALERLIGAHDHAGELASRLKEHPYCVLLLDEFEKADQSVHDLFLQILDEGVFTDGRGQQINARNTIVIATSNAGGRLIIETVQSRQTLDHLNQGIIDRIIADGIYRPELINRFDSTIIFEPLTIEEQQQVAQLLLKELYVRTEAQGYTLSVDDDLVRALVAKGYHPEFGARPMKRVIQDLLEEKIAQMIIAGTVQKGDAISLSKADFTPEELQAT